jgi:large subunit ribosomal protein L6
MSRLAKKPILLPKGVEINSGSDGLLRVKGPKGTLEVKLSPGLSILTEADAVIVNFDETVNKKKAEHGLFWALVKNAIEGVSTGFEKKLTLIGVGYRAALAGTKLDMQLGFSHPTVLEIPTTIQVTIEKGTAITIKGSDRHEVGQFAAAVRALRPPEPYKGKGVRYENEFVRKKEGKAAKGK